MKPENQEYYNQTVMIAWGIKRKLQDEGRDYKCIEAHHVNNSLQALMGVDEVEDGEEKIIQICHEVRERLAKMEDLPEEKIPDTLRNS